MTKAMWTYTSCVGPCFVSDRIASAAFPWLQDEAFTLKHLSLQVWPNSSQYRPHDPPHWGAPGVLVFTVCTTRSAVVGMVRLFQTFVWLFWWRLNTHSKKSVIKSWTWSSVCWRPSSNSTHTRTHTHGMDHVQLTNEWTLNESNDMAISLLSFKNLFWLSTISGHTSKRLDSWGFPEQDSRTAPDKLAVALFGWLRRQYVNVCLNGWIKACAKCPQCICNV